jgi:heptosyltransferase-1
MNVLLVRLGALGDVVHAIPAAAALRKGFPDARLDWLVDAKHRDLVDLVSAVDRTIAIERPSVSGWTAAVRALRQTPYDVAIDFQGLLKSAVLARASGAARVIGFSIWHLREKTARPFYSQTADAEGRHVIRNNLRLLRMLGLDEAEICFPLRAPASPALDRLRERIPAGRPFVLINPSAAWPNKRWPAERFGELAAFVHEACAMTPVVLWGPGEQPLAEHVAAAASGTAILAPPTGIVDLVALARAAALVVSGDTGPLHIAIAAGTPTVSIFGPTDPARNGPFSSEDLVVSRYEACGCHYDRRCHEASWCLAQVSTAEMCAAVQRRLATRSPRG